MTRRLVRAAVVAAACATVASCASGGGAGHRDGAMTVYPGSTVPSGWQVYAGRDAGLALARPADWSVDTANATAGEVSLAPTRGPARLQATLGTKPLTGHLPAVPVLRDRYVSYVLRGCEGGRHVGTTGTAAGGGLTFATVTATCSGDEDQPDRPGVRYLVGVAVHGATQVSFVLQAPPRGFGNIQRAYLEPMLATLHVYR